MGTIIRLRRLSFLDHVARLDHMVPVWKALDLALRTKNVDLHNVEWRHPRGRPGSTWLDHIKDDVAAPFDSLMCLAADRRAWKSFRYGPPRTMRLC